MNWFVERRLDFIQWHLIGSPMIRREDITAVFGISVAQASGDLSLFQELHPSVIIYSHRERRYERGPGEPREVEHHFLSLFTLMALAEKKRLKKP